MCRIFKFSIITLLSGCLLLWQYIAVVDCELLRGPSDVLSVTGSTVTLHCATNISVPVQWEFRRAGAPAEEPWSLVYSGYPTSEITARYRDKSKYSVTVDSTGNEYNLMIYNLQTDDAGTYRCVDDYGFGASKHDEGIPHHEYRAEIVVEQSLTCSQTIRGKNVEVNDEPILVEADDMISMSCSITYTGNIRPTLTWFIHDEVTGQDKILDNPQHTRTKRRGFRGWGGSFRSNIGVKPVDIPSRSYIGADFKLPQIPKYDFKLPKMPKYNFESYNLQNYKFPKYDSGNIGLNNYKLPSYMAGPSELQSYKGKLSSNRDSLNFETSWKSSTLKKKPNTETQDNDDRGHHIELDFHLESNHRTTRRVVPDVRVYEFYPQFSLSDRHAHREFNGRTTKRYASQVRASTISPQSILSQILTQKGKTELTTTKYNNGFLATKPSFPGEFSDVTTRRFDPGVSGSTYSPQSASIQKVTQKDSASYRGKIVTGVLITLTWISVSLVCVLIAWFLKRINSYFCKRLDIKKSKMSKGSCDSGNENVELQEIGSHSLHVHTENVQNHQNESLAQPNNQNLYSFYNSVSVEDKLSSGRACLI